jgi:hypothetical protein
VRSEVGGCADSRLAFYVDGATIPDVDWDIGPSWAGLLPISGNANETREVSHSVWLCGVIRVGAEGYFLVVLLVLPAWAYGSKRFVDTLDKRRSRMLVIGGNASGTWGTKFLSSR